MCYHRIALFLFFFVVSEILAQTSEFPTLPFTAGPPFEPPNATLINTTTGVFPGPKSPSPLNRLLRRALLQLSKGRKGALLPVRQDGTRFWQTFEQESALNARLDQTSLYAEPTSTPTSKKRAVSLDFAGWANLGTIADARQTVAIPAGVTHAYGTLPDGTYMLYEIHRHAPAPLLEAYDTFDILESDIVSFSRDCANQEFGGELDSTGYVMETTRLTCDIYNPAGGAGRYGPDAYSGRPVNAVMTASAQSFNGLPLISPVAVMYDGEGGSAAIAVFGTQPRPLRRVRRYDQTQVNVRATATLYNGQNFTVAAVTTGVTVCGTTIDDRCVDGSQVAGLGASADTQLYGLVRLLPGCWDTASTVQINSPGHTGFGTANWGAIPGMVVPGQVQNCLLQIPIPPSLMQCASRSTQVSNSGPFQRGGSTILNERVSTLSGILQVRINAPAPLNERTDIVTTTADISCPATIQVNPAAAECHGSASGSFQWTFNSNPCREEEGGKSTNIVTVNGPDPRRSSAILWTEMVNQGDDCFFNDCENSGRCYNNMIFITGGEPAYANQNTCTGAPLTYIGVAVSVTPLLQESRAAGPQDVNSVLSVSQAFEQAAVVPLPDADSTLECTPLADGSLLAWNCIGAGNCAARVRGYCLRCPGGSMASARSCRKLLQHFPRMVVRSSIGDRLNVSTLHDHVATGRAQYSNLDSFRTPDISDPFDWKLFIAITIPTIAVLAVAVLVLYFCWYKKRSEVRERYPDEEKNGPPKRGDTPTRVKSKSARDTPFEGVRVPIPNHSPSAVAAKQETHQFRPVTPAAVQEDG